MSRKTNFCYQGPNLLVCQGPPTYLRCNCKLCTECNIILCWIMDERDFFLSFSVKILCQ